ncbi:MAG: PEP-CTERM sorting domain-containing protein [Phycisphaerae bacterium]|nr:PEP-CTERM sorting domain-containing protein [Phycisphaerae bacterium]
MSPVNGTFSGMTTNAGFDFTSLATKNGAAPAGLNKVLGAKGLIAVGAPAITGDIWAATFTFDAPITAYVNFDVGVAAYAKDSTGASMAIDFPHLIPEPMTMALLGLGGLFLRRRV